jgi:Protein kinase domain
MLIPSDLLQDVNGETFDDRLVCIFKHMKSKDPASSTLTNACTRYVQRLRTIKHPYILSYVDSVISDDSVVLVTENAKPLDVWIESYENNSENLSSTKISSTNLHPNDIKVLDSDSVRNDLLWGLHCICTALDFLHSKVKVSHNNLSIHSIFVISNGDWKIGGLDFTTQPGNVEDEEFLGKCSSHLTQEYLAPERVKGDSRGSFPSDVFSLSKVITYIFAQMRIKVPDDLDRVIKKMSSVDMKRRPTAAVVQTCRDLSSDYIALLTSLNDLALKTALEVQDILQKLIAQAPLLSKSICCQRVLNIISQQLKMAVLDFSNRDSRESARQVIYILIYVVLLYSIC